MGSNFIALVAGKSNLVELVEVCKIIITINVICGIFPECFHKKLERIRSFRNDCIGFYGSIIYELLENYCNKRCKLSCRGKF